MAEGVRSKTVNRRLNSRWRNQLWLIAVAPGMQNLQGDFAAFVMHRVRDNSVMRQLCRIIQDCAALHRHA